MTGGAHPPGPLGGGRSRSRLTAAPYLDALEQVRLAAHKHGKARGLLVNDGAAAAAKLEQGWTFVAVGSDSTLLAAAAAAQLARARAGDSGTRNSQAGDSQPGDSQPGGDRKGGDR